MGDISRRRAQWPRAATPAPGERAAAVRPANAWAAADGVVSRPSESNPRWRAQIAPAYAGLPTRTPFTMPAVPQRSRQGKNGWAGWPRKFGGLRKGENLMSLPAGGDPNTPTGINGFGVPPVGNLYLRPHYRPPAVGGAYLKGVGPRIARPGLAQMSPPRRLTALLPNPENLYEPPRYGESQPGRGPATQTVWGRRS